MGWKGQSRLQMILRLLRASAVDPMAVGRALPGHVAMQLSSRLQQRGLKSLPHYEVDEAWDEDLHSLLGADWPCPMQEPLDELMAEIGVLLANKGLGYGRHTYGCYSDADSSLGRAVWCAVIHTRPEIVIETGVAHGVTTRIVLEAMRQNDYGHLWSIDLPHFFDRRLHAHTGIAVTDASRARWSYVEGSSKQRLPPLIAEVGQVQVFIHDSLHTARNTIFEMEQAAAAMPQGGVMLIDDITTHKGFAIFASRHPEYRTIIAQSADGIGHFGIAVMSETFNPR
jgi:Methyltransferase domain